MPFQHCVVDANVALLLVLKQDLTQHAFTLFDGFFADEPRQIHVPDVFFGELINVLVLQTRLGKSKLPIEHARAGLIYLNSLSYNVVATQTFAAYALELAVQHRLNGYDAIYVALAEKLKLPLVTADRKLVNAMQGLLYDIRWLGDVVQP